VAASVASRLVSSLPTGTVTFLFTDIEGSTRLWEERPEDMRALIAHHDKRLRMAIEANGGYVFATGGDGFAAAFGRAADAVAAAEQAQSAISDLADIRVRMGINTGEVQERGGDYFGSPVNRAARLMAAGHGGQVLIAGVTAELVSGLALKNLGEHRLRDLGSPMSVWQLGAEDFPPIRSLEAVPSNLPVQLTSFVGRDAEVQAVAELVREHRIVTITGVGGVGKTRLALHVAAELLVDSTDGVWVAELGAVDDGEAMAEVVANALGVSRRADATLAASIVEALRAKRVLLVIDNCEHLLGDVADFVDDVVQSCAVVRVLATSREGLGVAGERVWPLRSLAIPAPTDPAEVIVASAAAQLLVDRARAVVPNFEIDGSNSAAVGEICRRLDGIPLAIELAAARLAAMQPREIAAHLDERFRILTGGRRRGIERHQTLRATVDWSYSLLDDRDRLVFDRLGVFAGTFDAEAALAVVGNDGLDRFDVLDALDALNELVAKSMLVAEPGLGGDTRYQLLETLRQYALERLDAHDASDRARRCHAEHYARFAETAAPHLLGRHELEWRARVNVEIDNFRAAVTWALDRADHGAAEIAMRIIGALTVESVRNRGAGIGNWAEQAVASPATANSSHRAAVLVAAGFGAYHRLDSEAAVSYVERAAAEPDEPMIFALAEAVRGNVAIVTSGTAEAFRIEHAALVALEGNDDTTLAARLMLCPVPIFAAVDGRIDDALVLADGLLEDARRLGQPTGLALALYARGFVLVFADRDREAAYEALTESIALTRAGASDAVFAQALTSMAQLHLATGRPLAAIGALREAIAHSHGAGDMISNISAFGVAVLGLAAMGRDREATTCAGACIAGVFAPFILMDGFPGFDEAIASLRGRLRADDYDAAYGRGGAADYNELVAYLLTTFDEVLAESPQT
jgi:predicted ATPase/class 3 adenylate cyclase